MVNFRIRSALVTSPRPLSGQTLVRIAQPDEAGELHDSCDKHVGHRYDVVMCLFRSIGYVQTLERVTAALRCSRQHLADGGVIVVEPWFAPGVLRDGRGSTKRAEADGVRVERSPVVEEVRHVIRGLAARDDHVNRRASDAALS